MTVIDGRAFHGVHLTEDIVGPLTLRGCSTRGGSLGARIRSPETRISVSNVLAEGCAVNSATVGPVVFDSVVVDRLEVSGELRLAGCAFRHCVLRGQVGSLVAYATADYLEPLDSPKNHAFFNDNLRRYAGLDWALDISEADFDSLDLRGVPAELVRVGGDAQVRVRYEGALSLLENGRLDGCSEYARTMLEAAVEQGQATRWSFVVVASRRKAKRAEMLTLFERLGENGALF